MLGTSQTPSADHLPHPVNTTPALDPVDTWPPRSAPELTPRSAGVTGLSVALRLLEAGITPTLVSRAFPSPFETSDALEDINYASQWAGAHNRYHAPPRDEIGARDHELALKTYRHMEDTAKRHPEAGVSFMLGVEYIDEGVEGYEELTEKRAAELGYEEFRFLVKEELPAGVKMGFEYRTWSVNPMVYCSYLLRRLHLGGCKVIRRELSSPEEVFAMKELGEVKTVVNCSGMGFNDPNSYIARGEPISPRPSTHSPAVLSQQLSTLF